jgi:hypothetical protein
MPKLGVKQEATSFALVSDGPETTDAGIEPVLGGGSFLLLGHVLRMVHSSRPPRSLPMAQIPMQPKTKGVIAHSSRIPGSRLYALS